MEKKINNCPENLEAGSRTSEIINIATFFLENIMSKDGNDACIEIILPLKPEKKIRKGDKYKEL